MCHPERGMGHGIDWELWSPEVMTLNILLIINNKVAEDQAVLAPTPGSCKPSRSSAIWLTGCFHRAPLPFSWLTHARTT